jgi:hypothetical protein
LKTANKDFDLFNQVRQKFELRAFNLIKDKKIKKRVRPMLDPIKKDLDI